MTNRRLRKGRKVQRVGLHAAVSPLVSIADEFFEFELI